MKTLRQRFDQNEIPMQTVAALSGAQLSEVSRLVSGRQKVNADRAKDIVRTLETLERLLKHFSPVRPDLFDVKAVRRALKQMEREKMLSVAIRGATPIPFATYKPVRTEAPAGAAPTNLAEIAQVLGESGDETTNARE